MSVWTKASRPANTRVIAPTVESRLMLEPPICIPSKNTG